MRRLQQIGRHGLAIILIAGLAVGLAVYANPYSLHRVTIVSYDAFETPPDADGVVHIGDQSISVRSPKLTLAAHTVERLRERAASAPDTSSLSQISVMAAFVREHLNATDATKPSAADSDARLLVNRGTELFCLCSDHALLLNETLQAVGLTSRVVWLEGHVANEFYDEQAGQWAYIDAHQNVVGRDAEGQLLSVAQLIRRLEQDEPVTFDPLTPADTGGQSLQYDPTDAAQRRWYRNVLLNGECYTLSGSTLQSPSRWSHLARHGSLPQMLLLRTDFDSSPGRRIESFNSRKALLAAIVLVPAFYLGGYLLFGRNRRTAESS